MSNSFGSLSSKSSKESVVFSVRVGIQELATLTAFLNSVGQYPRSGGHSLSMSLQCFYEYLVATKKSRPYDIEEAKRFCERSSVATGTRRNVRKIGSQLEEYSTPKAFLSTEQVEYGVYLLDCSTRGIASMSQDEWKKSKTPKVCLPDNFQLAPSEEVEPEESIPADTDELLSALEQGKPKLAE
jgi:hypothetical protein